MDNKLFDASPWSFTGIEIDNGNITIAFLHTNLEEGVIVFVEMPIDF